MDGQQWLATYRSRLAELGILAEQAQSAFAACEATASSRDGAVTVVAGPGGVLRQLVLSEQTDGMPRAELAATVLATVRQAQSRAARAAVAAVAPLVGADGRRALRAHLPVEEGR